jgi:hypothetical protein
VSQSEYLNPTKNVVPEWASAPFTEFLDHVEELTQVTLLSVKGIQVITSMPTVIAAIRKATNTYNEERAGKMEALAELAIREVNKGFPLLFAQGTILLWSSLEFLVKDFLICWLLNEPSAMQIDAVQKLKIPLAQYNTMTVEERHYFIIDSLERETQAILKRGISRFETSLAIFGLSGDIDKEIQKNLFELSNMRNVLVHRRGKADRKFVEACPWLNLTLGEPVTVAAPAFQRYSDSVTEYMLTVFKRVATRFGVDLYLDNAGEWQSRNIIVHPATSIP